MSMPAFRLLGWSAFAGFTAFVLGWPLNTYIAKRNIKIEKSLLSARDKRMGVLNELIGAVSKFRNSELCFLISPWWCRSSSSNYLHGRVNGLIVLWMWEMLRWNGLWNVWLFWNCKVFVTLKLPCVARINTSFFFILGFISPILVSLIAFFAFVMQGNELTIGTAFTVRILDMSRFKI